MSSASALAYSTNDVEVAVLVEDAGVDQFELAVLLAPRRRFSSTSCAYGNSALRVLVEVLHVGVRRRAVEVEVVLLHVLAVVALVAGQAEEALLEDRVALVPQREREADLADGGRRSPRARPRSSGTRASARDRAGGSPRRRRARCSPRAPCPTRVRSGTAPTASSSHGDCAIPRVGVLRRSQPYYSQVAGAGGSRLTYSSGP